MAHLSFDYIALGLIGGVALFFFLLRGLFRGGRSQLFFSNVSDIKSLRLNWLVSFPGVCKGLALGLFLVAFADPHLLVKRGDKREEPKVPVEGVAIYLVLDQSGSMSEEVFVRTEGQRRKSSKLELMKGVAARFVEGRPFDLVGLVTFARKADVKVPLTLDHGAVFDALAGMQQVSDREKDGTAIGYAIYKTALLVDATIAYGQGGEGRPAYDVKSGAIVLVTDGFQDPNPLDYGNAERTVGVEEAATFAAEKGLKLYIVNVEPKMNVGQYAPHRQVMQRAAEKTGGAFFQADSGESLDAIFEQINSLEKGQVGQRDSARDYDRISYYPYFVALGMAFLALGILFEAGLIRRVP